MNRVVAPIIQQGMLEYLRLFDYDAWANRQALRSLENVTAPRSLKWMAHIIGAECLWLDRLQERPPSIAVWPELTLQECAAHQEGLERLWRGYLESQTAETLRNTVAYMNSKGERWTNSVQDVLTHVVMHGTYHRGQIAADVRAAGSTPAYTDFIEAVRRGKLG